MEHSVAGFCTVVQAMNEQEKKWPCPQCTYDNYLASVKCALCLHPRDSALIHLPPATASENGVLTHKNPQINNNESALIICPPAASSKVNSSKTNSFEVECASVKCEDKPQTSLAADNKDTEKVQRWFCSVCTHENLHAATQCFQCHSIKPELVDANLGKPRITNEQPQKWACPICTYENWNASKYCTVCRTDRCNAIDRQSNAALENIALIDARHSTNDEFREQEAYLHKSKEVGVSSVLNTCAQRESAEIAQLDNFLTAEVHHPKNISRSSSSSSSRSHSPRDDVDASGAHQTRSSRRRRQVIDNQACSSRMIPCSSRQNNSSGCGLSRSSSSSHLYSAGRLDNVDNRSYKNRARNMNWLFIKACIGVVDGNAEAVDAYLSHGGNIARTLTAEEIHLLNRPSAFDVGHTLVHLAIRFQRHSILRLLLTPEIAPRDFKRSPAQFSPDIADLIRREIAASIRTKKGDFHCCFLSELTTFQLPVEICDLPASVQKVLFKELLDQDVQKELEDESAINWSPELLRYGDCSNHLYALWNRSAGDCLLDSVLQATWGVFDCDNGLRTAMSESLENCATCFFKRWCEWEHYQADLLGYSLTERQCLRDWAFIHSLARQPGASLEHCHIFVLAHVLRRPIIVYGIKYLKSFRGETLGFARFQGVYLPLLWDQSFCFTSPVALGYTRGHFTALVTMEDRVKNICAAAHHRFQPFNTVNYLPLVDSAGKILPLHFTARGEGTNEEQRKALLCQWLDCQVTESGCLVARQRPGKRPSSVTRLVDEWLDHYRHLSFRRLGEEGRSDDEDD